MIPPWDEEGIRRFIDLTRALAEKDCDQELLSVIHLICMATDLAYPTSLEWAEHDPIFLHTLLCEICEDFEAILTEEHECYVMLNGGEVSEDDGAQVQGNPL